MKDIYSVGIDIGSTTLKLSILDKNQTPIFSAYERHYTKIQETLHTLFQNACTQLGNFYLSAVITGSGGLALADQLHIPFVQEVIAVTTAIEHWIPKTDVAIELGGEDAKIIYLTNGVEQRMNGICAGGTGSFIDQMATLLKTDAIGLNTYAKQYQTIYPIASRCGVFAKSDIQPLLNDGATKQDLAASIFQAVVNQTISGLACGKPIRGTVAFLGGPLHFLTELRARFIDTLHLSEKETIIPQNSHLFAASGSALCAKPETVFSSSDLLKKLLVPIQQLQERDTLEPLFLNQAEYAQFEQQHQKHQVKKRPLANYKGNCFVGVDAGSTTTKLAVIAEDGSLLHSFYSSNEGNPLKTTSRAFMELYNLLPKDVTIARVCATGYGEALIKAAFQLEEGEVETVAHYRAASFFDPKVDCILDIGGQDMKCIRIKQQAIYSVQLNEACSSGCGSFIETFAKSLQYDIPAFVKEALFAKHPVDLGTRCTVFMNSKVKQAQKDGATVADLSAGLAYSVVKNALLKVMKLNDPKELGTHIVVQGGTFYNDAILRSFEKITKCHVIRPDISGIMGAFGAALLARAHYEPSKQKKSTLLSKKQLQNFSVQTSITRCQGCTNHCRLTVNRFADHRTYISGNRCEKAFQKNKSKSDVPNLFAYKKEQLFSFEPLPEAFAYRGVVGIPRVLNLYENYPFWFTFFTALGFRVILSPESTHDIYELGMDSIPSESECYPAKLVHGHITWLLQQNIPYIFYPCIPYERKEVDGANNHYNCPIVTSYAENIEHNIEALHSKSVLFQHPFCSFETKEILEKQLQATLAHSHGISASEIQKAVTKGWDALCAFRKNIQAKGEEVLRYLEETNQKGIVLAGRPYHIDSELNHGIPELITSYGIAVLTEDSISHLGTLQRPLIVMDQWMYHSRLYQAAAFVKTKPYLEFVQLTSFGCGLDAVTTDQAQDILTAGNRLYTALKIDEIHNLGAAKIRIRSLLSAMKEREEKNILPCPASTAYKRILFTKQMRKDYTLLCPQMSPIHFSLLEAAFRYSGYRLEVLHNDSRSCIDVGLHYVNHDACYPSLIVVGQIMQALLSGKYDLQKVAILISQTGGGCRASNYISFIRRALKKAGYAHIPVVSINAAGLEKNPGFHLGLPLLNRALQAVIYGDLFMRLLYRTRPYEVTPNSANQLYEKWNVICKEALRLATLPTFSKNVAKIVQDFDQLPLTTVQKPRVGIVGEILVKFSPTANNHLVERLEAEGAQAVVPDLLDFFLYSAYNNIFQAKYLGKSKKNALVSKALLQIIAWYRKPVNRALRKSKRFTETANITSLVQTTKQILSIGNQTGEGWFLTAEMLELLHADVKNIICAQPFACLPNHIMGKGVLKTLRAKDPEANLIAIDYDPGASEVNQWNRIKLMLATANKNLKSSRRE